MNIARALLAAGLLVMLLSSAGCRSAQKASGLTPVKLQADWYPQPELGGFYDAVVKGFYKDEGLYVQILPGGPYISSEPLVASGAVQFGLNTSDHLLESIANSNEPIIAVGATCSTIRRESWFELIPLCIPGPI
jgi:NitT/TauT family transport system substrate-binding protein